MRALRRAIAGGAAAAVAARDSALAAARCAPASGPAGSDGPAGPAGSDGPARAADSGGPADLEGTGTAWVLGFGETATGLGQAVAEVLRAPAFTSTRRPGPPGTGPGVTAVFTEAHSHASEHAVTAPAGLIRRPGVGVLVDDELSTGATALAAIRALHELCPRARYVLATLVDVSSDADRGALIAAVTALGAALEVVSLARGAIQLPPDLPAVAAELVDASAAPPRPVLSQSPLSQSTPSPAAPPRPTSPQPLPSQPSVPAVPAASVVRVPARWPDGLPDSARTGFPATLLGPLGQAAREVADDVRSALGRRPQPPGPVLVLGTEEHLDTPLRIAEALADARDSADGDQTLGGAVFFSSTSRSPVAAVDDPAYAVRTSVGFASHDQPADGPGPRFAHNIARPPEHHGEPDTATGGTATGGTATGGAATWGAATWSAIVVVVDRDADSPELVAAGGLVEALRALTGLVLLVTTGARAPVVAPQDPLRGPEFGSYGRDEVGWLLSDLSTARLDPVPADREEQLQRGRAHYAESLPVEYEPSPAYRRLYDDALTAGARRTALAVGLLADLLVERAADRDGAPAALVSLARAGTPVGILLRRWFARAGIDVPHLAVSIVRGRGIDRTALDWLAARYDPAGCVFVDGWTGKGAIARELRAAVTALAAAGGPVFDPELAVLADPGSCTPLHGTREDWLIPSSCLNSTVSGLVSRTVLNDRLIGPADHHGGVFYAGLAAADRSGAFLDAVSGWFDAVSGEVAERLPALLAADRTPTWAGWTAVAGVADRFGITDLNLVKPGVGETTRVLLRRRPWQVLLRRPGEPDLAHIERLAAERGVPVVVEPDLPYACIGLIRPVGAPGVGASGVGAAGVGASGVGAAGVGAIGVAAVGPRAPGS